MWGPRVKDRYDVVSIRLLKVLTLLAITFSLHYKRYRYPIHRSPLAFTICCVVYGCVVFVTSGFVAFA
jgi:hypothetical protein